MGRFLAIILLVLSAANADATFPVWVSPTGAATYEGARSRTPLEGAACTSIATLNATAIPAGETIYLRGGEYDRGIILNGDNGTSSNRITIAAYGDFEPVVIRNATYESSTYVFGLRIQGSDYVTIKDIRIEAQDTSGSPTGNRPRPVWIQDGSDYIELIGLDIDGSADEGINADAVTAVNGCDHGLIKWCKIYRFGKIGSDGQDNGGCVQIGTTDHTVADCSNWTIRENVMHSGCHHVLETYGQFNVIVDNLFWNKSWVPDFNDPSNAGTSDDNGLYGNRVLQLDSPPLAGDYSEFNLVEGNRFAGSGVPSDDDGDAQVTIASQDNIVRYNFIYGSVGRGLFFKDDGLSARSVVYNNTFWNNAREPVARPSIPQQVIGLSSGTNGVAIINNLIWDTQGNAIVYLGGTDIAAVADVRGNYVGAKNVNAYPLSPTNPGMLDLTEPTTPEQWVPDLRLPVDGLSKDGGTWLTQANGSGTNSTTLVVDKALFFQDGTWGSSLDEFLWPDWIAIGTVTNEVEIASINYATNTITLEDPMTWVDDAPIYLYERSNALGVEPVLMGDAPDQGAFEIKSGDTYYSDGSQADVKAWHDTAEHGDTCILPAGRFVWRSEAANEVFISKAVTLMGQGWGENGTIIEAYVTRSGSHLDGQEFITFSGNRWRFSNVEIVDEEADSYGWSSGNAPVRINGGSRWVLDHVRFYATSADADDFQAIRLKGRGSPFSVPSGLVWKCTFDNKSRTNQQNGDSNRGDAAWAEPVPMGTINATVWEENTHNLQAGFDGDTGAVLVSRFSDYLDSYVHAHGAESGARPRGTRWNEVYRNNFEWVDVSTRVSMVELRSGSWHVFENDIIQHPSSDNPPRFVIANNYRVLDNFRPWFYADGKNWWDLAWYDDTGAGFDDTPAGDGVYETGTITSWTDRKNMADSSKSGVWADNQWNDYTMRFVGPSVTAAAGSSGNTLIVSPDPGWSPNEWAQWGVRNVGDGSMHRVDTNTSDTITFSTDDGDFLPNDFDVDPGEQFELFISQLILDTDASGNIVLEDDIHSDFWTPDLTALSVPITYEIRRLRGVIDGHARGVANVGRDVIHQGDAPTPPLDGYYSAEGSIPGYEWKNLSDGSMTSRVSNGASTNNTVASNRDYFDWNQSFDGSDGVGSGGADTMNGITGTVGGVAFWNEDEGDWDRTTPGTPDGQLYVWRDNRWELYYTPLIYPHPWRPILEPLASANPPVGSRLRLDNTKRPIKADGTGRPYIFSN